MKSWKTTVCGVAGLVAAVATGVKAFFDGDPETGIDFGGILAAVLVLAPSLGLLFARDNDKSSEDVGTK